VATRDRDGPAVAAFDERAGPASEDELEPVEPADPVVSAKAVGIEAMPAPTPRAKASAPTLPTYREYSGDAGFASTARIEGNRTVWAESAQSIAENPHESLAGVFFPRRTAGKYAGNDCEVSHVCRERLRSISRVK
jgi:hypothetical protein